MDVEGEGAADGMAGTGGSSLPTRIVSLRGAGEGEGEGEGE